MQLLLRSVGLSAEAFASAHEFLGQYETSRGGCLVLDIRMPGLGGLELQDRLHRHRTAERSRQDSLSEIEARISRLTNRERQVMELVVSGKPNQLEASRG